MIRSIDILAQKEYNYEYEDDKIVRATESKIELNSNEIVISKTLLNSVRYYYNDEGQMTKKVITFANGSYHLSVLQGHSFPHCLPAEEGSLLAWWATCCQQHPRRPRRASKSQGPGTLNRRAHIEEAPGSP